MRWIYAHQWAQFPGFLYALLTVPQLWCQSGRRVRHWEGKQGKEPVPCTVGNHLQDCPKAAEWDKGHAKVHGRSEFSTGLQGSLATGREERVPIQRILQKDNELGRPCLKPRSASKAHLWWSPAKAFALPLLKGLAGITNLLLIEFSRLLGLKISEGGNLST